ncbi:MAG: alpha/beta hydrolase [Parafilimonas sp.]
MKKIIHHNNARLVYHVYGNGNPVVLLHGFAETNSIWNNQLQYLSNYCTLIIPDLPGSGESELPDISSENLSIEALAENIYSIIQNEKINRCIMLGHSMGGYITLAFAEKYSEKLKAFGFVNSTAFADSEEKKQVRTKGIEMIGSYGTHAFLKNTTPNLFADEFKKDHTAVVNKLIEEGSHFEKTTLQQYYFAMRNRPDRTHVLKNNNSPVLFVMATEDVAAPMPDVLKQVHLPEIAYIHIIKNAGHMTMLEAPEKLNWILKNFANAVE